MRSFKVNYTENGRCSIERILHGDSAEAVARDLRIGAVGAEIKIEKIAERKPALKKSNKTLYRLRLEAIDDDGKRKIFRAVNILAGEDESTFDVERAAIQMTEAADFEEIAPEGARKIFDNLRWKSPSGDILIEAKIIEMFDVGAEMEMIEE